MPEYEKRMSIFSQEISSVIASFSKSFNNSNDFTKIVSSVAHFIYYSFHKDETKIDYQNSVNTNFQEIVLKVAFRQARDLQQNGILLSILKFITPSNKHRFDIMVPKICNPITLSIMKSDEKVYLKNDFNFNPVEYLKFKSKSKIFDYNHNVRIRYTSSFSFGSNSKQNKENKAIIIYIHGGGFFIGSSKLSDMFVGKWCKITKYPVFSIDYRLAPENKFPLAIDDVFQGYMWLINFCIPILKVNYQKVILTGDSAGGNLAIALTILCIKKRIKVPDGIFLAYPACSISFDYFIPSIIRSFDDSILSPQILEMCYLWYLGSDSDERNSEFATPILLSDEIVKKFPPTRFVISGLDPLRDSSYAFFYKLILNGVNARLIEFSKLIHGFLQMENTIIHEAKGGIEKSAQMIQELVEI